MKQPFISIILPTLNERENIKRLVPQIVQTLTKHNYAPFEIIVVDDNSSDNTYEEAVALTKTFSQLKPFKRSSPDDLGKAILFGITKSKGEIIIGMDADGNHDPKVLPNMLEKLHENDLVVASRFIDGGGMSNRYRYYTSYVFNKVFMHMYQFPITDNTSGYYAIKKVTLDALKPSSIYFGYGDYHLRLVWKAAQIHAKIAEVPIYYQERTYGKSKSKLLTMARNYLKVARELKHQV